MTGPLGLDQPLVLSPMVDVTDAAFRSIAAEWGADMTCSEMVAAAGLIHDNDKSWRLVDPWPGESPYGVQLMGSEPEDLAAAVARVIAHERPDFIDLNLGCPSPNILRSCAGGFLLRDPAKVGRVVAACVEASDGVPISVKLRKGHDARHETYLDVGAEAQAAGAAWCTLHGRTVEQRYSGEADWASIAKLVAALDIPVVGNGDLRSPGDVLRMRDETGCAGFFIARAAMHDPTVFRRMRQALDGQPIESPPDLAVRLDALDTYLDRSTVLGDVSMAVLKRQAMRFIQGVPGARKARVAIHAATSSQDVRDRLRLLEVAAPDDEQ